MFVYDAVDAVYDTIQPPGQVAAAEVVCRSHWQSEEENCSWVGLNCLGSETKDVEFHWVERHEDRLQKVLCVTV